MGLVILITINFIPTIVAACRGSDRMGAIFVINLLLGWTIIGWIVALVMACGNTRTKQPVVIIQTADGSVATVTHALPNPSKPRGRSLGDLIQGTKAGEWR